MLGSAAEAEDVVQDVWMRWQSTNRNSIENPPAYLATTATRLCINLAQSARSRHETYTGTWLPEPVDTSADPEIGAERGEALKLAVLLLLEKLSPTERAAYVLREAFDYPYDEIGSILQMEEANVRQLVSRARKHILDGRRTSVSSNEQRRFLEAFIAATQKGDMTALEGLFAEDVVSYSHGAGLVRAAGVPVSGRKRVVTFIAAVSTWY
jgi:RNA polymerase sigma-70 factor (ECF subfamily)